MLDFGALPPEVNSGLIYAGPGSGPMMAAASAWDALAAEVDTAASGYGSVVSELTGAPWVGPASKSMVSAVTPFVTWLSTVATQAEETANQARAAAGAYEAAFTMTVPPPVIAANRVLLMTLIATDFFGVNSAAIAATEAQYAEMWAQDAAAMYGYAGSATTASQLTPFVSPPQTTTPNAAADQAGAVAQANASSAATTPNGPFSFIFTELEDLFTEGLPTPTNNYIGLSSSWYTPIIKQTLQAYFAVGTANFGWSIGQTAFNPPAAAAAIGPAGSAAAKAVASLPAAGARGGLPAGIASRALSWNPAVHLSAANKIGGLSVPQSWGGPNAEVQAGTRLVSANLGEGSPAVNAALRGVPLAAAGGRGTQAAFDRELRYGFRKKVLSRPPSAG